MDHFSRNDLRALLANGQAPCISLLMPTTRGTAQEDKTRWKNLLREAEQQLKTAGRRGPEAKDLLSAGRELLDDVPFWLNVSEGLAAFLSPELVRTYRLPLRLDEQVIVADRFHIKPLPPLLMDDGRFYVLALSQKNVRLLRCTQHTAEEIDLGGVPHNLSEALGYGDQVKVQSFHTHTAAGGPASHREAIVHGQGVGIESAKQGLLEYFQQIDRGLHSRWRDEQAPLIVAAADFLLPIYRQANSYAHLLPDGVEGHPDRLSATELRDRAWSIVRPHFEKARQNVVARYRQLAGTGRTSNDLRTVVTSAYQGQIQHLLVEPAQEAWGTFDPARMNVELHDAMQPGDEDLVNLAAVHTLLHKGTVYSVEAGEIPERPVAAVFWLPLGQRSSKRTI